MPLSLTQKLDAFSRESYLSSLKGLSHGIERECLRISTEGELSMAAHPKALGSALTHPMITTDYSEALLEFITPVTDDVDKSIAQLEDIHKFTYQHLGEELLWPMSMPCFIGDEDKIPLAYYGESNIGTMKTVYRQGLKNRYGSNMQVISGIHFNFSFSDQFWQQLQNIELDTHSHADFKSQGYFDLIRNYKRFAWLIPYLYGSSPVICPSFIKDKGCCLPFKQSVHGAYYLEHATSLRMSDLGYTNSAQSALNIGYNSLDQYIVDVRNAISLGSQEFEQYGVKVDGKYQQLNTNILQIENELYAPIRAKRVAKSGEKPSDALANRGVEYIEVRALDVNPFSGIGITKEQIYFLDVFLTYCALAPSDELSYEQQSALSQNMDKVILEGRKPGLTLIHQDREITLKDWGLELFAEFAQVAKLLDKAHGNNYYSAAVARELEKVEDSSKTPSARMLHSLVDENKAYGNTAINQAMQYKREALAKPYQVYSEQDFIALSGESERDQLSIEKADTLSFDDFIADYFKQ